MKILTYLALCSFLVTLVACGDGTQMSIQDHSAKSTADSLGGFNLPQQNDVLASNLLVNINVSDADGLQSVALSFNQQTPKYMLCYAPQTCSGTSHSGLYSGIYPGQFSLNSGPIELGLWVTDLTGTEQQVASVTVDWQPPTISGVQFQRSSDGTSLQMRWDLSPQLLRYNVYLAAQTGVNQQTYLSLSEGQAQLATPMSAVIFTGLEPSHTYYVLLVGVDGSGESAFLPEMVIQPHYSAINNPPVAQDDNENMVEDSLANFSPLNNDSDPDGDTITLVSALVNSGQVSVHDDVITYQPLTNLNGQIVIDYLIQDELGLTDSAQILVQISAVNDAPTILDETVTTLVDTAINIRVLDNDSDPDNDVLTVDTASAGYGTVIIENDQSINYVPSSGYVGTDTVSYQVNDGNGGLGFGAISITISRDNLAPEANDDSYVIYQNTPLQIAKSSGLLINDSDPNGDLLKVDEQPLTPPNAGNLVLNSDGSFTFDPPADFVGRVSFTYEVADPYGDVDSALVTIDVQTIPAELFGDSLTFSGDFYYIGLGETSAGNGIGSGLYRIGECIQVIDTVCAMQGEYIESTGSGNQAGQGGRYAFLMQYSGVGDSPVVAASVSAGSNSLNFIALGDAKFELSLFPTTGELIKAVYPDSTFSTLSNFGAFIRNPQTCTGIPVGQACNIANVGLTAGATDTAPLDTLNFTVSGYATIDVSNEPVAIDDDYQFIGGQALTVNAPGVLANDSDLDLPIVGNNLVTQTQVSSALSQPIGLGVDEYRQLLYVYSAFDNLIAVFDRSGQRKANLTWQGEGANDADIEIAPVALSLANVDVPQGSVLLINGETTETEIYAIDPDTNSLIATLNTAFGDGHVVGGAYNPLTQSFFLLQDNVPAVGVGNQVVEIDAHSGAVLSSFLLLESGTQFDVSYGDLDINNMTGNLYLVSSSENSLLELTKSGQFVRTITLPQEVNSVSGLAINQQTDRFWFVNNTASSAVFEAKFDNDGQMPGLIAQLISTVQHGSLTLNLDGSFVYVPESTFVGEDNFTYQVSDQTGKIAQAKVVLTVLSP